MYSSFFVEKEDKSRLDVFVKNKLSISRKISHLLIKGGTIFVNKINRDKDYKLQDKQCVEFKFFLEIKDILKFDIVVLYEDDFLLIIDKPYGSVVSYKSDYRSILHSLSKDYYIIHRLDRETTGVLILAKTLVMQKRMQQVFQEKKVHKEYIGICNGNLNNTLSLFPLSKHKGKVIVDYTHGKNTSTSFKNIYFNVYLNISMISILMHSGRTHQIRVHLNHMAHPLIEDKLYGFLKADNTKEMKLHARRISFMHPITENFIDITSNKKLYEFYSLVSENKNNENLLENVEWSLLNLFYKYGKKKVFLKYYCQNSQN